MDKNWINDLRKYLFSHRAQDVNIEAAMEIKKQHIPNKLYKYREVNDFSLNNLREDTVWCANAADFKDPYDSSFCFSFEKSLIEDNLLELLQRQTDENGNHFIDDKARKEITNSEDPLKSLLDIAASQFDTDIDITPEKFEKLYSLINDLLNQRSIEKHRQFNEPLKRSYKICSFSERVDSMLMWSHYTGGHKGFAIEYGFSDLPVYDVRSRLMWPVIYDSKLFDASAFFQEQNNSGSFNNLFGIVAAIHKAEDWNYEKEWRMIIPLGPSDPPLNYRVPTPKTLYIGSKISEENKALLIDIAESKNIPVFQMEPSYSEFKMVHNEIDLIGNDGHNL